MFETVKLEFVLRAAEPIAHHKESIGNHGVLMTRDMRLADGSVEQIPIITADTMRHGMRSAVVDAYLDAAGLLGESLTEEALRLLYNGGNITGSAGGSVKMGDYWRLCELMPHLGLFGGNAQNRSIPGRLQVGDATMICEETLERLPAHVREWCGAHGGTIESYRAYTEVATRVRMDATLDPAKRALLLPEHRESVARRLLASEAATNAIEKAEAKSSMLPRSFERITDGALFHWYVSATLLSELDRDTFFVSIASFLHGARVGGKRSTGHGTLTPVCGWNVHVRRLSDRTECLDVAEVGATVGTQFRAQAAAQREDLAAFLAQVAA